MNGGHYLAELPTSDAYERVDRLLKEDGVVLDGGVATELLRIGDERHEHADEPWGTWALLQGPMDVLELHRRYVASGCDVLSTNTWSVLEAAHPAPSGPVGPRHDPLWVDAARQGVRLARAAIEEAERGGEVAVAFCANSALLDERAQGRLELLTWAWQDAPPDMVILETLEAIPDRVALETIAMVCDTGLPVWVSFRRGPQGMSTVEGKVTPDPDPDAFGTTLSELEKLGVRAILVNCVPAGGLAETLRWLRAHTELPIGAYPNLGHHAGAGWEFDREVSPRDYAKLADSWREAGASIVGGCCGVTPEHIAALRDLVGKAPPPAVELGR
jgi:S-methylmethionine-dependent homocysteine/selenocysteine methylase